MSLATLFGAGSSIRFGPVLEVIDISANRTLAQADSGKGFRSTAGAITVTLPADAPKGWNVTLIDDGASGRITLAVASGATNRDGVTATSARYKMLSILCIANATGSAAEYKVIQG